MAVFDAALPNGGVAQVGAPVIGRVVEVGSNVPIAAAVVELLGYGATLTSREGTFLFDGVGAGTHTMRVTAYGYVPDERQVTVGDFTVVDFELRIAPVAIDSLTVDVRVGELEGRVRDARNDFAIVDALIFTRSGMIETDDHGRFRIESVPENQPVPLRVQAFGYVPVDTVLLPVKDSVYQFELEEDLEVRALIDAQVERLEERVGFRWAAMLKPLNREDLIGYAGSATMWDVLLFRYERWLDQVKCVVLDEQVIGLKSGPIHNTLYSAQAAMVSLVPEEVERVEFHAFGGTFGASIMRVYTRDFMSAMVSGTAELVPHPYGTGINCD
jgi:hypothetical protein